MTISVLPIYKISEHMWYVALGEWLDEWDTKITFHLVVVQLVWGSFLKEIIGR